MNCALVNSTLAVEVRDLGLQRQGRWILRDLNWRVPRGVCAAILGPNGSGKSTLARVLACQLWPTVGRCDVLGGTFGDSQGGTSHANLPEVRHAIRLVQAVGPYDLDEDLTTEDIVLTGFFGTIGLYDPVSDDMRQRAAALMQRVGLSGVTEHRYNTLSSGERMRALIARALVVEPQLLLLDEPTNGLDLLAREQVLATIQTLFTHPSPPAVVLITHHVEELPPATSEILLLSDGRAAAQGPPHQVLQSPILSEVYRCPVEVRRNHGRYALSVNPQAWGDLLDGRR